MRSLRTLALALAFAAPAAAEDLAIRMADGNVLRGERVLDPTVANRGIRLRTGGITVFVPWSEMAPGTRELLEAGVSAQAPASTPPPAPGAGEIPGPPPDEEALPVEEAEWAPGEPPPMPGCCDPRF